MGLPYAGSPIRTVPSIVRAHICLERLAHLACFCQSASSSRQQQPQTYAYSVERPAINAVGLPGREGPN
eukprot:1156735-Pelagomonas_calceolata.AAC.1